MKRIWTPEEDAIIKALYADNLTADIARRLNRSESSVYNRANKFNLRKSEQFFLTGTGGRLTKGTSTGASSRFKPGQTPYNKGITGIRVSPGTEFKKGHIPWNALGKKDGDISIRYDKRGVGYKFIRLEMGNWYPLHRYVWEQTNGPIPKGLILVFRDGNTMNCALENLELITRAENMQRNTIHNYPEELIPVIKIISKIKKKVHEKQGRRPA